MDEDFITIEDGEEYWKRGADEDDEINKKTKTNQREIIYEEQRFKNGFQDFFAFRIMVVPCLVRWLFWLHSMACVISGVYIIVNAESGHNTLNTSQLLLGLGIVFLGPLVVRIYCEFIIVIFRINETLTEIKNKLK